jgi:protoporphyrinogen/coproporphyrinogen III oxidase
VTDSARVAVVGGGAAGLTAGWRLALSGARVTVFESRAAIGGRMRTDEVDGYHIDTFVQLFGSMYRTFFRVLDEIGGASLATRAPGRDALFRNGRVHEVTYGSVGSMLASGGLSFGTKVRLGAKYLPFLTQHASVLEIESLPRAAAAGLDAESIAEWGRRELGSEFVEYLVDPLLASYYGVTPEETSAAMYHMLASQGTNVSVYAIRGGAGRFCDLLALRLGSLGGTVRTGTTVQRITAAGSGVQVGYEGGSEWFDGAVVSVPGDRVPGIVPELPSEASKWFGAVRYRPLAALALLLSAPVNARYFGLSFPRAEAGLVATVCIEENKSKGLGLVPPGRGLLLALLAPAGAEAALGMQPEELYAQAIPELARVFPEVTQTVQRVKLFRWPEGGPVFYPGYLGHLAHYPAIRRQISAPLTFGGDYLVAPGVEGAVIAGLRAADHLTARLGAE